MDKKYMKMDDIDRQLLGMYCQKYLNKKSCLGSFFSSISKAVKKAASGINDVAKSVAKGAADTASEVAKGAKNAVSTAYNAGTSAVGTGLQAVGSLTSNPLINTALGAGLSAFTGGMIPPNIASQLTSGVGQFASNVGGGGNLLNAASGLTSNLIQTAIPQLTAYATQGAGQYLPQIVSSLPQYSNIASQMANTASNMQGYYNPQLALLQAMMQQGFNPFQYLNYAQPTINYTQPVASTTMKGLMVNTNTPALSRMIAPMSSISSQVSKLSTGVALSQQPSSQINSVTQPVTNLDLIQPSSLISKLDNGEKLSTQNEYLDIPWLNAFKFLINDPNIILAIVRFGHLTEKPEEATGNYIQTQKVMSLLRGGINPIKIAKKMLLGYDVNLDALSALKKISTSDNPYLASLYNIYETTEDPDNKNIILNSIKDIEAGVNKANAVMNSIDQISIRASQHGGASTGTQATIDALTSLYNTLTASSTANAANTISLSQAGRNMNASGMSAQMAKADVANSGLSPTEAATTEENLAKLAETTDEGKLVAKMVSASAISKIKQESMRSMSSLAQALAKQNAAKNQELIDKQTAENNSLRNELQKVMLENDKIKNDYRDAQLASNRELMNKLERDNSKLMNKLVRALSAIDKSLNQSELLKAALDKVLIDNQDTTSLEYKQLAKINDQFKKQLALFNSLGIKKVDPSAVTMVYDLLENSLKSSGGYSEALKEEEGTINAIKNQVTNIANTGLNGIGRANFRSNTMNTLLEGRKTINNPSQNNTYLNRTNKQSVRSLLGSNPASRDTISKVLMGQYSSDAYPIQNILAKLAVAGTLLELARQMEIVDPSYAQYMFNRIQMKNEYNNYVEQMQDDIKDYLSGIDVTLKYATNHPLAGKLDGLIMRASNYIKALAFREPRFLNASLQNQSVPENYATV